ncbi:MAG: hypothetical protein IJ438_08765 [Clostridia bacterium]|nr:hypothetical protein [Clostridia bacterium]
MKRFVVIILSALCLMGCMAFSSAESDAGVTITLDKQTVAAGESITATIECSVSGAVFVGWKIHDGDTEEVLYQYLLAESTYLATPMYGDLITCYVMKNGDILASASATITGESVNEPLQVTFSFDKQEGKINEPVTVTYEITGGTGIDESLFVIWEEMTLSSILSSETVYLNGPRNGSLTFTPTQGMRLVVSFYLKDSENDIQVVDEIFVFNPSSILPLEVTGTLDETAVIGEPVTATYKIQFGTYTGDSFYAMWAIDNGDDALYYHKVPLSERSGTLTYTPMFGQMLTFHIFAADDTFNASAYSSCSLTGDALITPALVTVSMETSTAVIGQRVDAAYDITGGSEGQICTATWNTLQDGSILSQTTIPLTDLHGVLSYTPTEGNQLKLTIVASNAYYDVRDDATIDIGPAPTRLPGDVNADGTVNMRDALTLLKKLADWDVTINQSNSDVNGDGAVNMRDALTLLKYLAGWDVTLN